MGVGSLEVGEVDSVEWQPGSPFATPFLASGRATLLTITRIPTARAAASVTPFVGWAVPTSMKFPMTSKP